MANVKTGVAVVTKAAAVASPLGVIINRTDVQERFKNMLGKKSAGFLSSLLSVVNNNDLLKKANPATVLSAAATAAALDLPINPSLGKAYIVPYGGQAQFQIGYRGLIELAQRSGVMKSIVMTPVYEGEITEWNRFTETYTPGDKKSDKVVGYYARFEQVNGFAKAAYWTIDAVKQHALKFNPMCKAKGKLCGTWVTNFDAMACKTVLKSILATYAPMSIEMQNAIVKDGAIFNDKGEMVDANAPVDVEYEEMPKEEVSAPAKEEYVAPAVEGEPTEEERQEILRMMDEQ